ncbi:hypothetical protein ACFQ1I_11305 [Kitasatospora arboriphila]
MPHRPLRARAARTASSIRSGGIRTPEAIRPPTAPSAAAALCAHRCSISTTTATLPGASRAAASCASAGPISGSSCPLGRDHPLQVLHLADLRVLDGAVGAAGDHQGVDHPDVPGRPQGGEGAGALGGDGLLRERQDDQFG